MKVPQQLLTALAELPDYGFYGSVEINLKDSIPGWIKITQTKQLDQSNGTPQEPRNARSPRHR